MVVQIFILTHPRTQRAANLPIANHLLANLLQANLLLADLPTIVHFDTPSYSLHWVANSKGYVRQQNVHGDATV